MPLSGVADTAPWSGGAPGYSGLRPEEEGYWGRRHKEVTFEQDHVQQLEFVPLDLSVLLLGIDLPLAGRLLHFWGTSQSS